MTPEEIIEPLHDWLLVQTEVMEEQGANGLIIPENARDERSIQATILRTGPLAPEEFAVGQRILKSPSSGVLVQVANGEEVTLLTPTDVLAFAGEA